MENYDLKNITNTNIKLLVKAAERLGITCTMIDDDRYLILYEKDGYGHVMHNHSQRLNTALSVKQTSTKRLTHELLRSHNLPVLPNVVVSCHQDYLNLANDIPFPQVIKPVAGEKGHAVFLDIPDQKAALQALDLALKSYPHLLVEPFFKGQDLRIMCLDHKIIGISQRRPPEITGDGKHTIKELILLENERRLQHNETIGVRMLNQIQNLDRIIWYLGKRQLALATILPLGTKQRLHDIPNYSAGGSVRTYASSDIHPTILDLAQRVSQATGLTICGIDFLVKDLKKTAETNNCVVVEVNSDPGLRLHDLPNEGKPQKVCEKLIEFALDTKYY